MDHYTLFYNLVKDKLQPKFLCPLDIEEDTKNNICIIFKNDNNKKFITNMNDKELFEYLNGINLFKCSFYKNVDYTLNRLYEKLNYTEKEEMKKLLHHLSLVESDFKDIFVKKLKLSNIVKEKINEIMDIITAGKFKNPSEIATIIDRIFLNPDLREEFFNQLKDIMKERNIDSSFLDKIITRLNENFEGFKTIMDFFMKINYPINIYYSKQKQMLIKELINEIFDKSVYLNNIESYFEKVPENNETQFKKKYKCYVIDDDYKELEEPLQIFNYILNDFSELPEKVDFHYNLLTFKIHLNIFFLHLYNVFMTIKLKYDFKTQINDLVKNIEVNNINKEDNILFENFSKESLDILTNSPDDIPKIIENFNKLDFKDKLKTYINNNKENVVDLLGQHFKKLGLKRSDKLQEIIKTEFNVNVEEYYDNLISYMSDETKNVKIIYILKIISKIIAFKNDRKIIKKYKTLTKLKRN